MALKEMNRYIREYHFKQPLTSLLGLGMMVLAASIMYKTGEINGNGIIFTVIGLICWGLPKKQWDRLKGLITKKNEGEEEAPPVEDN